MKKLMVLAALTMAAPAAMASKARVEALGNSRQLVDVQYVFDRPYLLNSVGDQVTIEWGGDTAAARHAEGGFIKAHNDMVFGLYLGKQGIMAAEGATLAEQNPINLLFGMKTGDIAWGVNLGYSNGKKDATTAAPTDELKSSSTTLNVGAKMGQFSVDVGTVLTAKSENVTAKTDEEIKNAMNVGVDYEINESSVAYVTYNTHKVATTGNPDVETNATEVGYINTFAKNEEVNFFYGVGYRTGKQSDLEFSALPVWMGVEANATSWMVMRASVKQNIFVNSEEVNATPSEKQDLDSIAFNAGLGIKLGKGMLDANFGTAQAGHMSFSNGSVAGQEFMSNVAYTYMF